MEKDKYKSLFAQATAQAFRKIYPDVAGETDELTEVAVYEALAKPKDASMGRFALPVFRYAGLLKDKPPAIAAVIAVETNRQLSSLEGGSLMTCVATGGFLNAQIDPASLAGETVREVLSKGNRFGDSPVGHGKTCLVEYSSPNIAKPFGVGHLRSTVIGNSLRLIFRKLGYSVVGINYPGDWGTQFGKMIVAFRKWGSDDTLKGNAVKNLVDLYVRFHSEAEADTSLEDEARDAFKQLETGDPDAVKLWETFKKVSYEEFERVYDLLGVEFDWVYGEADLNDRMEPVIERLSKAGLAEESQGALVVHLPEETNLPPLLLRKSDGATLYATRDLAGLVYRWEKYHGFDQSLYVVNSAQADHFRQCFMVIDMLEKAEKRPGSDRMSGRTRHVEFGWVRFGGKTMSTRRGNTVLLEDVIGQARDLVKEKIKEKNPALPTIDETALHVGVGAVLFSQLSVRRQKDVDFQWEEVLSFEGETGPYLQYTHARLCALMRRFGKDITGEVDCSVLVGAEEQRVIELIADFPVVLASAGEQYEP
ncbi:MAG: arginine--tRNA ligase, partial [candidate division Zixibacteria bacterium]|nr:arginine--tRNA ligase [candidate division Zixibacteria bacterium]